MIDKGIFAPFLASSLVTLFIPENKSQFRSIKDLNSTKMDVCSINISVHSYSIYSNL